MINSITKPVISAAFVMLAAEGEVDLDASAGVLLSDGRFDVSVRQLLLHTSGIPDYGSWPTYHAAVHESPSRP